VIDIIEAEGLVERAAQRGEYLMQRLREVGVRHPRLANVRGRGLMVGFDVICRSGDPLGRRETGDAIVEFLHDRGIHIHPLKNRFRVMPPLTIENAQIDHFVGAVEDSLKELEAGRLRPVGPQNPYTQAMHKHRAKRGLSAMARWAWTHSPKALVARLRQSIVPAKKVRKRASPFEIDS
jgi:Aminotransferase class-III